MLNVIIEKWKLIKASLMQFDSSFINQLVRAVMTLVKSLVQRLNDGLKIDLHLTMNTGSTANEWAFAWSSREVELALKIAR